MTKGQSIAKADNIVYSFWRLSLSTKASLLLFCLVQLASIVPSIGLDHTSVNWQYVRNCFGYFGHWAIFEVSQILSAYITKISEYRA